MMVIIPLVLTACSAGEQKTEVPAQTQDVNVKESAVGDEALIREAISSYITTRGVSLEHMQMEFNNLSITGEEATVDVTYGLKGAPQSSHVKTYTLTRKSGLWEVVVPETAPSEEGMNPHGMMPSGDPHAGITMPEGHPPVNETGGEATE